MILVSISIHRIAYRYEFPVVEKHAVVEWKSEVRGRKLKLLSIWYGPYRYRQTGNRVHVHESVWTHDVVEYAMYVM